VNLLKKTILILLVAVTFSAIFLVYPSDVRANSDLNRINNELNALKQKKAEAQRKARETQRQLRNIQNRRQDTAKDIKSLLKQIEDSKYRLGSLQKQIKVMNSDLEEAITRLEKTSIRVYERDQQLKSRLRFMYTNGSVSYLEVLFNATDFSDFLDRYAQLSAILEQDKELLATSKREREAVIEQKKDIEKQLASLGNKYLAVEDLQESLVVQEQQKEEMIKDLVSKEARLEEISEEQEQAVVELARKESELLRQKNKYDFKYQGGKMAWPVPSVHRITSYFGLRRDPFTGRSKMHKGIDIGAPSGTTIVAAEQGVVVVASWTNGYGNTVIIDHGKNTQTWYAHIRNGGIKVSKGQQVDKGQKIAEVGTTGQSTGNHLHFEVRIGGNAVNPLSYVK
jgi:murein DD-endopeptidase MepM/ murein hydrolase activator NlpD